MLYRAFFLFARVLFLFFVRIFFTTQATKMLQTQSRTPRVKSARLPRGFFVLFFAPTATLTKQATQTPRAKSLATLLAVLFCARPPCVFSFAFFYFKFHTNLKKIEILKFKVFWRLKFKNI